ncbi:MAG: FecR family protein [Chitinophagaceae bacterium]|nr:FecR family protein [Chitinophagaceae bacterium]
MEADQLQRLFEKYVRNECTSREKRELLAFVERMENEKAVMDLIDRFIARTGGGEELDNEKAGIMLQRILRKEQLPTPVLSRVKSRYSLAWKAAAAVILFAAGFYLWRNYTGSGESPSVAALTDQPGIMPGGSHAILSMSDGRSILLDSMKDGHIAQGGIQVVKRNDMLIFSASRNNDHAEQDRVIFNTLSTPAGGQYQVLLPDGSKVWLNATSSLHFPNVFTGDTREVVIEGEGYFEVASNNKKPFHVKVGNMVVKVLGTHFNINAYKDDGRIRTSLLEGSIRITEGSMSELLAPGQQGILKSGEGKLDIQTMDMDLVIAWKNGLFNFTGSDFYTIMHQIGRWYDMQIEFEGKIPNRNFEGKISRSAQLSEILKILELQNLKFEVKGRKIIVKD